MGRQMGCTCLSGLLAVAACAVGPSETRRTVAGDPARAQRAVAAELTSLGFARMTMVPDGLEATAAAVPPVWAVCPPILVGDGDDRRRMASPDRRRAVVRVAITPAGVGTAVSVATAFTASYRNSFNGNGVERACRSTVAVEARLLDAVSK